MSKHPDPVAPLLRSILTIRGQKVMIDHDLALRYGVETKRLNEQVKRNLTRFPDDFMIQLTIEEKAEVVANCDHLSTLRFSKSNPYAFTEHGAVMLAAVLNSDKAVQTSILVVRAFIRFRKLLLEHSDLAEKMYALEKKYDAKFKDIFQAIRMLEETPKIERRPIGFKREK